MELNCDFQPRQIVYLEHTGVRLYAEVIQVVSSRQLCWVRPLLITDTQVVEETLPVTDLRSAPDLLWPRSLFQPALDTEVLPLLAMSPPTPPELTGAVRQQLSQFIHQVWQAHPSAF